MCVCVSRRARACACVCSVTAARALGCGRHVVTPRHLSSAKFQCVSLLKLYLPGLDNSGGSEERSYPKLSGKIIVWFLVWFGLVQIGFVNIDPISPDLNCESVDSQFRLYLAVGVVHLAFGARA